MSNNLATYFAHQHQVSSPPGSKGPHQQQEEEDMGPSVSMAVEANNDDDFVKNTFGLKRTRSLGLLHDYADAFDVGTRTSERVQQPTPVSNDERDDYSASFSEEEEESSSSSSNNSSGEEDNEYANGFSNPTSRSTSPPSADNDNFLMPQDDNDLLREPERHVDYLSHQWGEMEISNSWKYIILKKRKRDVVDSVNSARLENASWRTWAKARNHLKTVSPEIVNWSKDSDVTWLYGPVVCETDNTQDDDLNLVSKDDENYGYGSDDETSKRIKKTTMLPSPISPKHAPKPILKKRTVSEIIEENALWKLNEARKHASEMKHASIMMDPYGTTKHAHDDYGALAAKVNAQYYHHPSYTRHSSSNDSKNDATRSYDNDSNDKTNELMTCNGSNTTTNAVNNTKDQFSTGSDTKIPNHLANDNIKYSPESAFATPTESTKEEDTSAFSHNLNTAPLSSILTSPTSNSSRSYKSTKIRHIHFNDRVEQCMATQYTSSEGQESGSDNFENEDDPKIINSDYFTSKPSAYYTSSNSDYDSSSQEEDDDDEDGGGLFINARFARKSDNIIHSPLTDTSSTGSSVQSRMPVHPIIKLLPATTLNYGSDEESDNSDSNSYGNAVSHNVNTYRGYDYMYDYNSVYTGDTSNFLPMDHSGVVDIPEGIDLHTSMADDDMSTVDYDTVPLNTTISNTSVPVDNNRSAFLFNDSDSSDEDYSSSDSGQEFIEHSQDLSTDDDDEDDQQDLALKRTISWGKNSASASLKDLTHLGTSQSLTAGPFESGSLISGNTKPSQTFMNDSGNASQHRPCLVKKSPSSGHFIFNSESENEDDAADGLADTSRQASGLEQTDFEQSNSCNSKNMNDSQLEYHTTPHHDPKALNSTDSSEHSSSLRIMSSSPSPAEVGSSDVAIRGCFSPRSESIKSVVSKKGIIERIPSHDLEAMGK